MAEILHQLIGKTPFFLIGLHLCIHPRWLFGISAINSSVPVGFAGFFLFNLGVDRITEYQNTWSITGHVTCQLGDRKYLQQIIFNLGPRINGVINYCRLWFQIFCLCSSLFAERIHFDYSFSDGLKPPTSYKFD